MKFIYNDKLIELKGDRDTNIDQISPSQLRRPVNTGNTSTYFHIQLDSHHPEPLPLTHPIPVIQTLLTKYSSLFQPLMTLPPSRATNHSINLLPNSTPVNVKPPLYVKSHSASNNTMCTCVTLLLAKSVHPSRGNKYARVATIQSHA